MLALVKQRSFSLKTKRGLSHEVTKDGLFLYLDGEKIAKRGKPDTPSAGTWISLKPGWKVVDSEGMTSIDIFKGDTVVH